ncbi:hypothetical protein ACIBCA_37030 [Kitasatospora sp. NPDC051170]|uniref:hypothetical protein n=1 Tax=Kitasatospora sp. NPDC051170 TaxID=3364056 RepID=UPI0037985AC1
MMRALNWLLALASVGLGLAAGAVVADLAHALWDLPRPVVSLPVGSLSGWFVYSALYRLTFGGAE